VTDAPAQVFLFCTRSVFRVSVLVRAHLVWSCSNASQLDLVCEFSFNTCKGFCFSREVFLSRAGAADLSLHFSFPGSIPVAHFGLDNGNFFLSPDPAWARFSLCKDFAFFSFIPLQFLWSND
jgi:hypothetical protein